MRRSFSSASSVRPPPALPPGKLTSPDAVPRKSGFYAVTDPYAGLESLDRPELDDDGEATLPHG